jgi:cell division control protein 6
VISFRFVNLRKAKTVFGCANLILGNLGRESLSSAEGLNKAVDCIQCQIESILEKENKKFFVLVLDEYDVIFSDSRGNPSDFVYKLLQMEENLREKGFWICMITISNNVLQEYSLDDRVKSRMGSSSVSFSPYSKEDIFAILQDRSKKAFRIEIAKDVLEYCSSLSSSDHGDTRRALDLLRTAGEMCNGKQITKENIDSAQNNIQKDRAQEIVSNATYHMRCVAAAICYLALVNGESWSATSSIYKKYSNLISNDKPLSYRRVSDLLVELENSGLVVSRAYSRGRNGYGKEYKLNVSPDLVGPAIGKDWFAGIVKARNAKDDIERYKKMIKSNKRWSRYSSIFSNL